MPEHYVFVYGTLKKGEPNEHELCDSRNVLSKFVGVAKTCNPFPLIVSTKYNITFLLKDNRGQNVFGEVYIVDDKKLQALDEFENHPYLYLRSKETVVLVDSGEQCEVWIYLLPEWKEELIVHGSEMLSSYSSDGSHGRPYVNSVKTCEKQQLIFQRKLRALRGFVHEEISWILNWKQCEENVSNCLEYGAITDNTVKTSSNLKTIYRSFEINVQPIHNQLFKPAKLLQTLIDLKTDKPKEKSSKSHRANSHHCGVTRFLYGIKEGRVEKVRTQERINHDYKLRQISKKFKTELKKLENCNQKDSNNDANDDELTLWKISIRKHNCFWDKMVVRSDYQPNMGVCYEENESVMQPTDEFMSDEDCF